MHCVAFDCAVIYLFPLSVSFPVDTVTAVEPEVAYGYTSGDPLSSAEQPGKQPLFDHPDITYSLPLHSCIRFCYCIYFIGSTYSDA